LYFSSDCPDTDFCATLCDVYPPTSDFPDGFAMNLSSGIRRARFRESYTEPRWERQGGEGEGLSIIGSIPFHLTFPLDCHLPATHVLLTSS
jgi:hypothetical protein